MSEHEIVSEIRRVAAERPDYVYEFPGGVGDACYYVYDNEPSCIVGHALWNLNLLRREPVDEDDTTARRVIRNLGIDIGSEDLSWVAEVQAAQDRGTSWGQAVLRADRETGRD